jgi:hypothetical protein
MLRIADVLRRHGGDYLKRYGDAVLPSHVRAIYAITRCRTGAFGGHVSACSDCQREHLFLHSCRHRACPQCGHDATCRWLARQYELVLPVSYFHVVVTLPAELRRLVRQHQRALIPILFRAAFESLSALCADPHWLGGQVGALAVLHTWTRTLEWHPHLHLLVPGGALAPDGQTWLRPPLRPKSFLVPVKALAKRFRGRFLALARRALPGVRFPEIPWGKRWVAFAKAAVQGPQRVLEYLGRYIHRTALTDKAILHCDDTSVTFAYRDSRDHRRKTMTLPAHEFLRRFLQHVPPRGMHRVRAFGLLHPSKRSTLRRLQLLLSHSTPPQAASLGSVSKNNQRQSSHCPHCKTGILRCVRILLPNECIALATTRPVPAGVLARAPPHPIGPISQARAA